MPLEAMSKEELQKILSVPKKPRTPEEEARAKAFAEKVKNLSSEDLRQKRRRWEEEHGEL